MADKVLTIPHDSNFPVVTGDNLYIQASEDCTWCYSDPNNCFPGGLLANGNYSKQTGNNKYGPYPAVNAGSVGFDSSAGFNQPCNPGASIRATGHSIVVSG